MPRKNRCTALVLLLTLLACLAGQAAAALPMMGGSRAAANDSTGVDLLSAVRGWLADKWAALGQVIAAPAGHAPAVLEKQCSGLDPNNGCLYRQSDAPVAFRPRQQVGR